MWVVTRLESGGVGGGNRKGRKVGGQVPGPIPTTSTAGESVTLLLRRLSPVGAEQLDTNSRTQRKCLTRLIRLPLSLPPCMLSLSHAAEEPRCLSPLPSPRRTASASLRSPNPNAQGYSHNLAASEESKANSPVVAALVVVAAAVVVGAWAVVSGGAAVVWAVGAVVSTGAAVVAAPVGLDMLIGLGDD